MSNKKVGVTDLFKLQIPGEVVVLAKSAIFAYKSSSMRALNEWRGAIATWTCVRSKDGQKQLAQTSLRHISLDIQSYNLHSSITSDSLYNIY